MVEISILDLFNFQKIFLFFTVKNYTMVGITKLNNAYHLAKIVSKSNLKGSIVECGCYKGGCLAVMAYMLKDSPRKIYAFDSFEGLPEPTKKDGKKAILYAEKKQSGKLKSINKCVASVKDIKKIFKKLKLNPKNTRICKGWFQDTIPQNKEDIGEIAILRLDGDWYESERFCLENLYDNIISGGYLILDDYNTWEGSKKALDEFIENNQLEVKLRKVGKQKGGSVYLKKP